MAGRINDLLAGLTLPGNVFIVKRTNTRCWQYNTANDRFVIWLSVDFRLVSFELDPADTNPQIVAEANAKIAQAATAFSGE